ncbi:hypothetical protein M407DRAFT_12991, partial [Tulasnella calospora MUT 4182]
PNRTVLSIKSGVEQSRSGNAIVGRSNSSRSVTQDLYAPSSYTDSFASLSSDATTTTNSTNSTIPAQYADQHQHQHPHSYHPHHQQQQQQQQQSHHAYGPSHGVGAGVGDESMMAGGARLQPPSPAGYPLPPSVSHSLNSSAANSPPKDYLPQLQQQQPPSGHHPAAGDYGYGLPPPQVNPIDMVRHGSFSSVASSSGYDYTAAGAAGDDNGPPALEKAPPEVTGAFHHPWSHHAPSESAFHPAQPPQHPPSLPHHSAGIAAPHHPVQHQHQPGQQPPHYPPSRRGSFLEDLYTPSHSPSSHDFPNAATHHHIPPPAHHPHQQHHPHQHQQQQQDVSPLSRPLSDLAPGALGAPSNQQQQQAPLPRISTQFDDPSWPPATVSPEMTQHQPTSAVSPTTTLNGPFPNSSTGGGEYNHNSGGGGTGSGSATPQQGMFHHGHTPQPPFARRFSSPLVGGAPQNRGYEAGGGNGIMIGTGPGPNAGGASGGSPHSFPSLGQPDASHMAANSFGYERSV